MHITEVGKIQLMDQIWPTNWFHLARSGTRSPTWPKHGRQLNLWPVHPVLLPPGTWQNGGSSGQVWLPVSTYDSSSLCLAASASPPCTHQQGYRMEWVGGQETSLGPARAGHGRCDIATGGKWHLGRGQVKLGLRSWGGDSPGPGPGGQTTIHSLYTSAHWTCSCHRDVQRVDTSPSLPMAPSLPPSQECPAHRSPRPVSKETQPARLHTSPGTPSPGHRADGPRAENNQFSPPSLGQDTLPAAPGQVSSPPPLQFPSTQQLTKAP